MLLFAMLSAPAAAFALTPAVPEAQQDETQVEEQTEARVAARTIQARMVAKQADDAAVSAPIEAPTTTAMPVQLVSWDGDFEFMKTSRRLRIWRSHIAYNLTVDAEGNATNCELTETFRMRRVSERLCDVLMAHHTFEPAHDESGAPVAGEYSARLAYADMYERLN